MPAFLGVLDVKAQTSTDIVVAHTDETQRLGYIVGQLGKGHFGRDLIARDVLHRHGQIGFDDLVDAALHLSYLLVGGTDGQLVVELALLALDVGVARTFATEHAHHGLVEDVLGSVRRLVLLFVMIVEDGFWHGFLTRIIVNYHEFLLLSRI